MPEKTYLDANGNPAGSAPPVYLDPNTGDPITGHPDSLAPKGGWDHPGDLLRGAAAGVKQMFQHPLDTIAGMAEPYLAAGVSPSGYPTTAATGRPQDSSANAQVQQQAQQGQADTAHFIAKNPLYAAGGVIGPAAVTGTATKLIPGAMRLGMKVGGRGALLGNTPEGAYESALKPSTTLSPDERAAVVKTGLENEIPVSKGGLQSLSNLIDDYNAKIKAEIAADPNRPIDPNAVATRVSSAKARFANQVNAQGDLNAIEASRQQFLREQGAQPGKPAIPPQPTGLLDAQGRPVMTQGTPATPPKPAPPMAAANAQSMKQGTYGVLKGKFGEQGSASVEAQKALARGLKEEIAKKFPEINDLNAQESKLLDLEPILERAVSRTSNHQLIGIGTPVAGAAATAVTGSSGFGAVAGLMKAVLDNPFVKSRLAIAVSKGAKIPIGQASAKVQAYSAALGSAAGASQLTSDDQTANR